MGWELAMEDKKRLAFCDRFVCLGVRIDLTQSQARQLIIDNKPGRLGEIASMVDEVLAGKPVGFREALSLRGNIAFAESNLYGRVGAAVGHMLSEWSRSYRRRPVTDQMSEALQLSLIHI